MANWTGLRELAGSEWGRFMDLTPPGEDCTWSSSRFRQKLRNLWKFGLTRVQWASTVNSILAIVCKMVWKLFWSTIPAWTTSSGIAVKVVKSISGSDDPFPPDPNSNPGGLGWGIRGKGLLLLISGQLLKTWKYVFQWKQIWRIFVFVYNSDFSVMRFSSTDIYKKQIS